MTLWINMVLEEVFLIVDTCVKYGRWIPSEAVTYGVLGPFL